MIKIYPYEKLYMAKHGWLEARHHFSFANYYDPKRMGFGPIRVINDDIIQANSGFPTHPHQNMEIITYVRSGAITHKDSVGNTGRTEAGDVQVMSAGTGIWHSEYNLESDQTRLYQIWIEPDKLDIKPRFAQHKFPKQKNKFTLLVSGDENAPLTINQNIKIYAATLEPNITINKTLENSAYLLVSKGKLSINNNNIKEGDGIEITNENKLFFKSEIDTELLIIEF